MLGLFLTIILLSPLLLRHLLEGHSDPDKNSFLCTCAAEVHLVPKKFTGPGASHPTNVSKQANQLNVELKLKGTPRIDVIAKQKVSIWNKLWQAGPCIWVTSITLSPSVEWMSIHFSHLFKLKNSPDGLYYID